MKYKKWISETEYLRKPVIGDTYHCILVDRKGEFPPCQEILVYELAGWRVQFKVESDESIDRYRIAYWRSIPDFPDMKEVNERVKHILIDEKKSKES